MPDKSIHQSIRLLTRQNFAGLIFIRVYQRIFKAAMGFATQYISKVQEGLRFYLRQPPGKEMLHQVRVLIKKMRALWLVHPMAANLPFNQTFPYLHKLFKLAARIRDRQMVRLCMHALPAFLKHIALDHLLKNEIAREKNLFRKKLRKRSFRHGLADDLYRYREYYRMAARYIVLQNKKKYREDFLSRLTHYSGSSEEGLHELRRQIKYYIYQNEAFQIEQGKNPHTTAKMEQLVNLQHTLGIWHDWWNTLQWIKNYSQGGNHINMASLLEQATRKEASLKRELLREIRMQVKSIVPHTN